MKIFSIIFIVLFFNNICYSDYIQDLKRGADSGNPVAQNDYGYNLIYGLNGVEENDKLGMEYIRKAASGQPQKFDWYCRTCITARYFKKSRGARCRYYNRHRWCRFCNAKKLLFR